MRSFFLIRLLACLAIFSSSALLMQAQRVKKKGVTLLRYQMEGSEKRAEIKNFILSDACTGETLFQMRDRDSSYLEKADWRKGEVHLKLPAGSYYAEVHTKTVVQKDLIHISDVPVPWSGEWVFHLYPDLWSKNRMEGGHAEPPKTANTFRLSFYDQEADGPIHLEDFAVVDACAKRLIFRKGILEPADVAEPRWETGNVTLIVPTGVYEIYAVADGYEPSSNTMDVRSGKNESHDMSFSMVRVGWGRQGANTWKELRPDAALITGVVLDHETGRPLKGVTVRQVQGEPSTQTDIRGEFTLPTSFPPGNDNGTAAQTQISIEVVSTFYEKAQASVTLVPGGYKVQNFRLVRIRPASPSPDGSP